MDNNHGGHGMGRTSIKNKLILSFLLLLLMVMIVISIVNQVAHDFYIAQAISIAIAMASGVIFGSIFSSSIVNRLKSLSEVAKEISKGDFSKEIELLSHDEVRDLEEVFAAMVSDLKRALNDMKRVSIQIQSTNRILNDLFKKILTNGQMIDQSATDIAKGSEEQAMIVQKTSQKMDESLRQMDELVKNTQETVSKIGEARHKSEMGEANARETLQHLDGVLRQMTGYAEPIYRLSNRVEKIQLVIKVMDEIAQKTDLLSLNASIEATRAGELGKGFALVANEIRSMAENSKQSSHEIADIVESIMEENKAVIDALSKSQTGIKKGREIIDGIVGTFGETVSGVKDIFQEVKQIEEVNRRQLDQMKSFIDYFKELSRLAQGNYLSTQKTSVATKRQKEDIIEMAKTMKSLNLQSEKMIKTQQGFRLGEE